MKIHNAHQNQADQLTRIAHEAKQYWGYADAWMQQWQGALTITPAMIDDHLVRVAVDGNEMLGFYMLAFTESMAMLDHFWIAPKFIGQGIGRLLFADVTTQVLKLGIKLIEIDADPNAEGFYQRMGAKRVTTIAAPVPNQPERVLPRMYLVLGVNSY